MLIIKLFWKNYRYYAALVCRRFAPAGRYASARYAARGDISKYLHSPAKDIC